MKLAKIAVLCCLLLLPQLALADQLRFAPGVHSQTGDARTQATWNAETDAHLNKISGPLYYKDTADAQANPAEKNYIKPRKAEMSLLVLAVILIAACFLLATVSTSETDGEGETEGDERKTNKYYDASLPAKTYTGGYGSDYPEAMRLLSQAGTPTPQAADLDALRKAHGILLPDLETILKNHNHYARARWCAAANTLALAEQDADRRLELYSFVYRLCLASTPERPLSLPIFELVNSTVNLAKVSATADERSSVIHKARTLLGQTDPAAFSYLLNSQQKQAYFAKNSIHAEASVPLYQPAEEYARHESPKLWRLKHGEAVMLKLLAEDMPPGPERDNHLKHAARMFAAYDPRTSFDWQVSQLGLAELELYIDQLEELGGMAPDYPENWMVLAILYEQRLAGEQARDKKLETKARIQRCWERFFRNQQLAEEHPALYADHIIELPADNLAVWWEHAQKSCAWLLNRLEQAPVHTEQPAESGLFVLAKAAEILEAIAESVSECKPGKYQDAAGDVDAAARTKPLTRPEIRKCLKSAWEGALPYRELLGARTNFHSTLPLPDATLPASDALRTWRRVLACLTGPSAETGLPDDAKPTELQDNQKPTHEKSAGLFDTIFQVESFEEVMKKSRMTERPSATQESAVTPTIPAESEEKEPAYEDGNPLSLNELKALCSSLAGELAALAASARPGAPDNPTICTTHELHAALTPQAK